MTIRTVLRGLGARLADLAAARHTARGRSAENRGQLEDACRHYRAALALLHAMCKADRNDPGIRPADFPRLAREIAAR